MTKTLTKQKQLTSKKQLEFMNFVAENVLPFFEEMDIKFDTINPTVLQDEWCGKDILITIPYGERMEPWLARCISECYAYEDKKIYVVCGAKVNSNAFHRFVFPFASSIAFVRRGKRPTCIIQYTRGCESKAFDQSIDNRVSYSIGCMESGINDYMIKNLMMKDEEEEG